MLQVVANIPASSYQTARPLAVAEAVSDWPATVSVALTWTNAPQRLTAANCAPTRWVASVAVASMVMSSDRTRSRVKPWVKPSA